MGASLTVKAEREVRSHPGLIFHVTGEGMEAQRGEAPSWMSQGQQNSLSLSSFSVLPAVHGGPLHEVSFNLQVSRKACVSLLLVFLRPTVN